MGAKNGRGVGAMFILGGTSVWDRRETARLSG